VYSLYSAAIVVFLLEPDCASCQSGLPNPCHSCNEPRIHPAVLINSTSRVILATHKNAQCMTLHTPDRRPERVKWGVCLTLPCSGVALPSTGHAFTSLRYSTSSTRKLHYTFTSLGHKLFHAFRVLCCKLNPVCKVHHALTLPNA